MPNHVINEIVYENCCSLDVDRIKQLVLGEDGLIDFEVLLPAPLNIWNGSVGIEHKSTFPDTHLDWATKNWSTKWNAYGERSLVVDGQRVTLTFQTAWRPPYGWIVALFNSYKHSFTHKWLSEGTDRGVIGQWEHRADQFSDVQWKEHPADDATHKHLHLLLWGVEQFDEETA